MKLYVIELLKRDGTPYKKARYAMGSRGIDVFGSFKRASNRCGWIHVKTRIRTLALLPEGE